MKKETCLPQKRSYNNLKAELKRADISMANAAQAIGLSYNSLHNRLCGFSKFTYEEAEALADLLSVDIKYIMEYKTTERRTKK